jgi:tetratricopeptide (TPR) repeat protein
VPVDISGLSYEELEVRASQYFWAGDFKHALAVYDAMQQKVALEHPDEPADLAARLATLEVRRATTLKRGGALLSALASAERAISLSDALPEIQAEAYVVLASLQCQRGHLPLAHDAAKRAIELSRLAGVETQARAWMVQGQFLYQSRQYDQAKEAFQEALELARRSGDHWHMTHIEGDIGMCWLAQGNQEEAVRWLDRAVARAHEQKQPALEASWLVELGKIALDTGRTEDADRKARAALRIAKPQEHYLTVFRAEWLRYRVAQRLHPHRPDRQRLALLGGLYQHLRQLEGIEEIQEFKRGLRPSAWETREGT